MEDYELVSPANILDIALHVHDGEADPVDVRRLLETICHLITNDKPLPLEALHYIRDSFQEHLSDQKSLDRSFGVLSKRGRRKMDVYERMDMAAAVLELRLLDYTYANAIAEVADHYKETEISDTVVKDAWAAHKQVSILTLSVRRILDSGQGQWSLDEIERMSNIFEDEDWFKREDLATGPK